MICLLLSVAERGVRVWFKLFKSLGGLGLLLDALKQHATACRSQLQQQQQAAGMLGHGHDSSASLASSGRGPVTGKQASVAEACVQVGASFVTCLWQRWCASFAWASSVSSSNSSSRLRGCCVTAMTAAQALQAAGRDQQPYLYLDSTRILHLLLLHCLLCVAGSGVLHERPAAAGSQLPLPPIARCLLVCACCFVCRFWSAA
jgi:hypothetical protein